MKQAKSYCRMCGAMCGTTLTLDNDNHLLKVRADDDNPLSNGYICYKGLYADEMHNNPDRLLHTVKKQSDGSFTRIDTEQALDEIAEKMQQLIDQHGRDAIGLYTGGHSYMTSSAWMMLPVFRAALGTNSNFSTATIDQSAKFVAVERLGVWGAGKHPIHDSDIALVIGTNPLVAHSTPGLLVTDPVKTLKKERARGLKLIVIDPRRTETAAYADLFIQPWPGEDPTVVAGILNCILSNGWEDKSFVAKHVDAKSMQALREHVAPFTPEYVAARAGINAEDLTTAAKMFCDAKRGSVFSGTGPSMAAHANLSEHLIENINVICGRYRREGEKIEDINVFSPERPQHAEVIPPSRSYDAVPPSRIRGAGQLWGEKMTSTLPDEILTPGEGQVRCLINAGGNPASSFPDQKKTVKALKALDLLISIQPYLSTTARLADYVFSPKLQYERADIPMYIYDMSFYPKTWGQYTPEIVKPPAGSDLVDDWYVLWGIAKRLGLSMNYGDTPINMEQAPSTDDLLEIRCQGSVVPLEEIKQYPSGKIFDVEKYVLPARPEADGKFDVMPEDVAADLQQVLKEHDWQSLQEQQGYTHKLQVRRVREINNSSAVMLDAVKQRMPQNWAAMHPDDFDGKTFSDGKAVVIESDHGRVSAVLKADDSIRPGVISMTHCWGGLPDETDQEPGANVNLLIDTETHIEPINAMVRMSAIPVRVSSA